jgi:hypothetical protein
MDDEEEGVELEEGVEGARLVALYPSSHLLLVSQATIQHVSLYFRLIREWIGFASQDLV